MVCLLCGSRFLNIWHIVNLSQISDEVEAAPRKFRAQETDYEKYYEDNQLTKQRQEVCSALIESLYLIDTMKDAFRELQSSFAEILEDLGRTRAHDVNAISELGK